MRKITITITDEHSVVLDSGEMDVGNATRKIAVREIPDDAEESMDDIVFDIGTNKAT